MSEDKYSIELERAIFDWYYGGENSALEPMFNAIKDGLKNDMQVLVSIETPEEIHIKFQHLIANDQGQYYIPLFTSDSEFNKGESSYLINQSIKALFDAVNNWNDCLGFVINPWDKKLMLNKDMIQVIQEYQEKSHLSFI